MKKISKFLIAAFVLLALPLTSACGGSAKQPNVSELYRRLTEEIEFQSLAEVSADRLSVYYGVETEDVEDMAVSVCGSGGYPDEIALFKMKDNGAAKDAKEAAEERKEKLVNTFKDYIPEEMYKLDNAIIYTKGNYVCFVVCSDNDKAFDILDENF